MGEVSTTVIVLAATGLFALLIGIAIVAMWQLAVPKERAGVEVAPGEWGELRFTMPDTIPKRIDVYAALNVFANDDDVDAICEVELRRGDEVLVPLSRVESKVRYRINSMGDGTNYTVPLLDLRGFAPRTALVARARFLPLKEDWPVKKARLFFA